MSRVSILSSIGSCGDIPDPFLARNDATAGVMTRGLQAVRKHIGFEKLGDHDPQPGVRLLHDILPGRLFDPIIALFR